MPELRNYVTVRNRSPHGEWFERLDHTAAAKVVTALVRLQAGNTSNVKSVGEGVHELRIDFGPGYRVYFGWDGAALIILIGGGTKQRQHRDIKAARACWRDYKARRRQAN